MMRRLTIVADVLEAVGVPTDETLMDAEQGIRRGLENAGFDVGHIDVRFAPEPAPVPAERQVA